MPRFLTTLTAHLPPFDQHCLHLVWQSVAQTAVLCLLSFAALLWVAGPAFGALGVVNCTVTLMIVYLTRAALNAHHARFLAVRFAARLERAFLETMVLGAVCFMVFGGHGLVYGACLVFGSTLVQDGYDAVRITLALLRDSPPRRHRRRYAPRVEFLVGG